MGIEALERAIGRLAAALAQPKTEWTRDAAIQRFEFTFELAWKAVARLAHVEGIEAPSPRQALRAALRLGWIEDDFAWLGMLDDRNRTSHTYNEATAEAIYSRLPGNLARLQSLYGQLVRALDRPKP